MALRHQALILICAIALAMGVSAEAFARAGSGGSFGSRGGLTNSAPPATATAPRGAAPFQRSMNGPNDSIFRRPAGQGFFSGGFARGLLGGLLGAGLFGLLFGHGLFGGLGGVLSIFGLILQIGLLYLLFRLVMAFIRGWRPAIPGGSYGGGPTVHPFAGPGGRTGFGGGASPFGAGPARRARLEPSPADFDTFEQRLAAIQAAYGAEDLDALRRLATSEMASYFAEELAVNARKGLVNRLSDVTFLQGDLSEAWSEEASEYATVAMRFSLIDTMVDRASGRIVSGDPNRPETATEVWTFVRRVGAGPADWKLSAIQQA